MSATDPGLNDCGCCAGVTAVTPAAVYNRPGLPAIARRVGTHSRFLESMLADLSNPDQPALRALRTRDTDDFSIALLDAWATVSDVLSFYQERFANEFYLRTATERRSLLELARLIGYELNPGVAASTYLAFTLDTAPGAPPQVTINTGTKVQSVPGPGEKPQTFETVEEIQAKGEWNALAAQMIEVQNLAFGDTQVYLEGVATNLKPGDVLLFVDADSATPFRGNQWDFQRVAAAIADKEHDLTRVQLTKGLGTNTGHTLPARVAVYVCRQRAALFGANAPDWRTMPQAVREQYALDAITPGLSGDYFVETGFEDWQFSRVDQQVDFDWSSSSPGANLPSTNYSVRWTGLIKAPVSGTFTFIISSDDGVRLWVNGQKIIENWSDHSQTSNQGTIPLEAGVLYDVRLEYYQKTGGAIIQLAWMAPGLAEQTIPANCLFHLEMPDQWPNFNIAYAASVPGVVPTIHLDALYPEIVPGSGVLLLRSDSQALYQVDSTGEDSKSDFTLTAKTTTLEISGAVPVSQFGTFLRETVVFLQTEPLPLAGKPLATPISGNAITLASPPTTELSPGQWLAACGQDSVSRAQIREIVAVSNVNGANLVVTPPLSNQYVRESFFLNANVARATHGETVGTPQQEVLGSGDASQLFQKFTLRQSPLTWVSAPTDTGNQSTLKLFVNSIEWQAVPYLYGRRPRDRVFVTRIDDDGNTTVEFGDGVTGARLPTGRENVTATYRKGIGLAGLLKAGQLSLLSPRPLGVKSVTNPLDATGASDPESEDDARQNAPLKILTLGRIVSLEDYEDFARAFAGIAKALATWTWDGQKRGVFVTVAGPDGATVSPDSELYANLLQAMRDASDPFVMLQVRSYRRATFRVAAGVAIEPDHQQKLVLAAVEQTLRAQYSFAARNFAEPVEASKVVALIQDVDGVTGVDLKSIYRVDGGTTVNDRLQAEAPRLDAGGQMLAAELLMLDPGPMDELGLMT